jgi:putative protease
MPARKKAKPKRRKAPAKRPAARRKTAKKAVKKAPVRRAAPQVRRAAPRPAAAKPMPAPPASMAPPGERIGVVTHYYSHLSVAVVKLEAARLRVGDTIHIRGHTTDFKQRVESLEVNHASVQEVGPGDDFGLKVRDHAREHDIVYKVTT